MNCPNCGHVQPDGSLECRYCQIIIAKWKPRETRPPLPDAPRPAILSPDTSTPRPRVKFDSVVVGSLAGMLLCGLALWWVLAPSTNPPAADAYVNHQYRFAMSPPPDWIMLTRDNMKQIMDEYGDAFPDAMRSIMHENKNMAAGFFKLGKSKQDFSPSANVVIIAGNLPPINESAKEEASSELAKQFSSLLEDYRQESVEIVEVDGLDALEIVSVGSIKFKIGGPQYEDVQDAWGGTWRQKVSDGEYATRRLKFRQLLVPGRKRAYVVTFTALEKRWDDSATTFQSVLDSFRVLQRPPRFGPVLNGAIIGGLIGAILGLMGMLIKRFGGGAE